MLQRNIIDDIIKNKRKKGVLYMAVDVLINEAQGLPEDSIKKVVEYIHFLKYELNNNVSNNKKRTLGRLEGKMTYMADDFDATPECFKEYM